MGVKRARVGMIVWGSILLGFGSIIGIISISGIAGVRINRYYYSAASLLSSYYIFLAFALNFLIGGGLLLAFGIRSAALARRHNTQVYIEDSNFTYSAVCYRCSASVTCTYSQFRPHARFPEGFVYCPVCRTPLSINLFSKIPTRYVPGSNGH